VKLSLERRPLHLKDSLKAILRKSVITKHLVQTSQQLECAVAGCSRRLKLGKGTADARQRHVRC
jgi:hypothetical protein